MIFFHITMSQGRGDSFYLESTSKTKILNFLKTFSTAVVRNIKEIVYSKKFNVNYISKPPFVEGLVYHKVIIFAYSKNFSKQFTLYNVKKSISQKDIETAYKKLFIINEPILGFYDISFYNEISKSENIEYLYQVQYQRNSKTYTEEFYADSYEKVRDFFELLVDGELLEIRKYVHLDNTIKKDDGNYFKRCSFYISDEHFQFSSFIPKIFTNFKHEVFKDSVVQNLTLNGKQIDKNKIKLTIK